MTESPNDHSGLIAKHKIRLREIEAEADAVLNNLVEACPDNYRGKVLMILALALAIKRMSAITPGIREESFVADAMLGAAIWVDSGEPLDGKAPPPEAR